MGDWRKCRHFLLILFLFFPDKSNKRLTSFVETARKHSMKGILWWNLARTPNLLTEDRSYHEIPLFVSPGVHPLTLKQLKLVNRHPGTMMAVLRSTKIAVDECQHQFRHRRWNCPVKESTNSGSIFGKILKKGCMETSFIYAVTSAALTYTTSRACSEGSIYTCSCGLIDLTRQVHASEWQWGGCSDNVEFGQKFAREFTDVSEKERDIRCAVNRHNNEAGRLHVISQMVQECKCHGMSGSCSIKTCWMKLPSFRRIANILKDRFDGASKVEQDNDFRERTWINLILSDPNLKPPEPHDLVYFDDSPSFCEPDNGISFKGTVHRECNATSLEIDGCDIMCCGRGFKTDIYQREDRCNCIFHWCCRVTCEICLKAISRNSCL